MTTRGSAQRAARTAEEVHDVLLDAFNCGDVDALVAIYENDATFSCRQAAAARTAAMRSGR